MENEIDKEIMRAHDKGTPEAIFEVVKNFGEEFGQTNTCTSLKHLGDLVKQQPDLKDKILPSNEFEVLLSKAPMLLLAGCHICCLLVHSVSARTHHGTLLHDSVQCRHIA